VGEGGLAKWAHEGKKLCVPSTRTGRNKVPLASGSKKKKNGGEGGKKKKRRRKLPSSWGEEKGRHLFPKEEG